MELRVRRPAPAVRADARPARRACPARSATRSARRSGSTPGRRRTGSWSGWRCSACSPRWPRSSRCLSSSTTRSGSTAARRRRSRSSRAACWQSRSRWCSRCATDDGPDVRRAAGAGGRRARASATPARCWTSAIPGPLDERVRDRIVAETRGNPLALLELPRGLTPAELAGGFGLPDARAARRAASSRASPGSSSRCPAETRLLLLLAAAEPVGDAAAAVARGRAARDRGRRGAPAEAAGLIEFGARVRFRHPLVRSAAYRAQHRRTGARVHTPRWPTRPTRTPIPTAAPGTARTRRPGPTRRWPTSSSARPAARRRAVAVAAAAAFLERAAELTPDPARAAAGRWPPRRPSSRRPRRTPRSNCSPWPSCAKLLVTFGLGICFVEVVRCFFCASSKLVPPISRPPTAARPSSPATGRTSHPRAPRRCQVFLRDRSEDTA